MSVTQSSSQSPYSIFISFTGQDKVLAEYLAKGLRRTLDDFDAVYYYPLPGRYNSKAGPRPADDYLKQIDDSLKRCNIFILLWSTYARDSNWVLYEFNQAKHFYIQKVVRAGQKFKIVPICINGCGLPLGIPGITRINHTTNDDMLSVLNGIRATLSLPAEHETPAESVMNEAIFDMKMAYRNGEWSNVTSAYPQLLQLYPAALSATAHYMYAISLFNQGNVHEAYIIVQEGLGYSHHVGDDELLYTYVQRLRERKLWSEVLHIAGKAMVLFPDDIRWSRLRLEAHSNLNQHTINNGNPSPASILIQPQSGQPQPPQFPQSPQSPSQPTSFMSFSQSPQMLMNGSTHLLTGSETLPFSTVQHMPYLTSSAVATQTREFPYSMQSIIQKEPVTEQMSAVSNPALMTQELSVEEIGDEDYRTDSLTKGRSFIETHFSSKKLRRLLNGQLLLVAFLDAFCLYLITSAWPATTSWMWGEFALLAFLLCIGRLVEAVEVKVFCLVAFCILWCFGGYSVGSQLLSWLGSGMNSSIPWKNFIDIAGVIAGFAFGFIFHHRLFDQKS